ncbi:MAG: phytanoyl-CoA dioxygenase family protein [Gammaproteobacteria bacterium]|nr:phytanoyl-CoA dioxygenase family protein [Gammaproteobacteria bacterium]
MKKQHDRSSSASGTLPEVPDKSESIATLREENARLRAEISQLRTYQSEVREPAWDSAMQQGIAYADGVSHTSSLSAGRLLKQLNGMAKQRQEEGLIRNSDEFDDLPKPESDQAALEADFVRWGYCLVADAMSPEQIKAQVDRMTEQAAAERKLNSAVMTSQKSTAQLVNNLVLKGQVFRDAVEFKPSAAQKGELVDRLLTKIMGERFGLGCAHGSIVHQGGGLQELHVDQAGFPMPYPPFPFGSLIIWCYTEFNLDNGATYLVPGSHRTASGATTFHDGADLVRLVEGEPGLVAVCAPPGTCILTDTRVLHGGGLRTAPGTRYAMRCHYNRWFVRALHEQASVNHHVPDSVYEELSPRLKQMMGIERSNLQPVGELRGNDRTYASPK